MTISSARCIKASPRMARISIRPSHITSYTGLSRDDAVAMKAYLFTLPPVHAPARPNSLSFPFNQRWALAFWNLVFLDQHRFRADPALSSSQNRGAYIATALGHCGECHTPRNVGFAMEVGRQFGGAVLQGWYAYNITADKDYGVGDWSDQQIADYLSFGHAAGPWFGFRARWREAVGNSLQYLSRDDTASVVSYLRHVEPQAGKPGSQINPAPARDDGVFDLEARYARCRQRDSDGGSSRVFAPVAMSGTAVGDRPFTRRSPAARRSTILRAPM